VKSKSRLQSTDLESVSTTFGYDLMLWSPQMEDACDSLVKSDESWGDAILIITARLARIAIKAVEVSRRASDDAPTAQHAMMAIEPLKLSLSNLKSATSPVYLQHRKKLLPIPFLVLKDLQAPLSGSCIARKSPSTSLRSYYRHHHRLNRRLFIDNPSSSRDASSISQLASKPAKPHVTTF
jgi:hypothetical protein